MTANEMGFLSASIKKIDLKYLGRSDIIAFIRKVG